MLSDELQSHELTLSLDNDDTQIDSTLDLDEIKDKNIDYEDISQSPSYTFIQAVSLGNYKNYTLIEDKVEEPLSSSKAGGIVTKLSIDNDFYNLLEFIKKGYFNNCDCDYLLSIFTKNSSVFYSGELENKDLPIDRLRDRYIENIIDEFFSRIPSTGLHTSKYVSSSIINLLDSRFYTVISSLFDKYNITASRLFRAENQVNFILSQFNKFEYYVADSLVRSYLSDYVFDGYINTVISSYLHTRRIDPTWDNNPKIFSCIIDNIKNPEHIDLALFISYMSDPDAVFKLFEGVSEVPLLFKLRDSFGNNYLHYLFSDPIQKKEYQLNIQNFTFLKYAFIANDNNITPVHIVLSNLLTYNSDAQYKKVVDLFYLSWCFFAFFKEEVVIDNLIFKDKEDFITTVVDFFTSKGFEIFSTSVYDNILNNYSENKLLYLYYHIFYMEFKKITDANEDADELFTLEETDEETPIISHQLYYENDIKNLEKEIDGNSDTHDKTVAVIKKLREGNPMKKIATNSALMKEIDTLKSTFPNFIEFIEHIENNMFLSNMGDSRFTIPPTLLVSDPGIGKTFFFDRFARLSGIPYEMLNMESMSASWIITGMSIGWSSASPGLVYKKAFNSDFANFIFILDEIDKTPKSNYPVEQCFLPLFEKHTAKKFKDEYIEVPIDISCLNWVATANNKSAISPAILSRFEVFDIPNPNFVERKIFAQAIYAAILEGNPWGKHFEGSLSEAVLDALCEDAGSSRDMRKKITQALSRVARRGGLFITLEDIDKQMIGVKKQWDRRFN